MFMKAIVTLTNAIFFFLKSDPSAENYLKRKKLFDLDFIFMFM